MMLARMLEPEVMDTEEDAREYDSMDHAAVNAVFVEDFLGAISAETEGSETNAAGRCPLDPSHPILDLGAGTAQIPIALCRQNADLRVVAVDAAESMLAIGREKVAAAGFADRIELVLADAKRLPFGDGSFAVVASNSIVHHIAEPAAVLAEAVRVASPEAVQFHRDLCRPDNEAELERLVATYAAGATAYQRKLFSESLRAALSLDEMQSLVTQLGFPRDSVGMTSDRHWTWIVV